jgi:hypothetical protein
MMQHAALQRLCMWHGPLHMHVQSGSCGLCAWVWVSANMYKGMLCRCAVHGASLSRASPPNCCSSCKRLPFITMNSEGGYFSTQILQAVSSEANSR